MTTDNSIDKLFRQELWQRSVEFDHSHWEAAEKLIESEISKSAGWRGWGKSNLLMLAVLLLLSGTAGYFIFSGKQAPDMIAPKIVPSGNTQTIENTGNSGDSAFSSVDQKPATAILSDEKTEAQSSNNTDVAKSKDANVQPSAVEKARKMQNKPARSSKSAAEIKEKENINSRPVESTSPAVTGNSPQPQKNDESVNDEIETEDHEVFKMNKAVITHNKEKEEAADQEEVKDADGRPQEGKLPQKKRSKRFRNQTLINPGKKSPVQPEENKN